MRKVIPLVLLSVLIIATGCQSIGGLDLNKILVNQIISDSMEGSMNVTLHLVSEQSSETDPETMEMIKAINGMQVVVESFKQQDWNTMSAKGKLVITRGEIPFQLSLSRTVMVMQIEGADVPIIIPLDSASNPLSNITGGMSATNELTTNSLQEKSITQSLVSLVIKHLANPEDISLQNVTETVHGESLSLYKIHSEIKGPEIFTLLKKSLRSLVMDDQGLKLFITQLYDVLEANATEEDDNLLGLGLGFSSADRELEIEFLHTSIKQGLLIVIMTLEDESTMSEIQPILTDDTYLRSDLYVDSSLNVRKADFELSVKPELENADPTGISAIQIESHSQFWNHNRAVTADTLTYGDKEPLYVDLTSSAGDELISILDKQSVLYKLVKEDLHATRKTAVFYADEDYGDYMSYELAIFKNGIMTVPARSLADNLGLQLDWNGVTRELTLTSPFDGTIVAFKVDSNKATVNGTDQTMPVATFIDKGQTYIPLRFVTDALGAKIEWSQETQAATVTIE
ncbi:MAG: copper amine oxidase N-terminal domain-containing protein [Paenibacillaceae bacterium]